MSNSNKSVTRLVLTSVLALSLIPFFPLFPEFLQLAVNVMLLCKDLPKLLSERDVQKHPSIEHEELLARLEASEREIQDLRTEGQRLREEVQRLKPPEN